MTKILPKDAYLKDIPGALVRTKKGKTKLSPAGVSEETIQNAVEDYLNFKGIKFIRIPDSIYRMCSPFTREGRNTKIWVAKEIKEYLSGIPDIIALKKNGELSNSNLALELKKKNAKPRQAQINWALGITVHYPDTIDKAINLIDRWMKEEG